MRVVFDIQPKARTRIPTIYLLVQRNASLELSIDCQTPLPQTWCFSLRQKSTTTANKPRTVGKAELWSGTSQVRSWEVANGKRRHTVCSCRRSYSQLFVACSGTCVSFVRRLELDPLWSRLNCISLWGSRASLCARLIVRFNRSAMSLRNNKLQAHKLWPNDDDDTTRRTGAIRCGGSAVMSFLRQRAAHCNLKWESDASGELDLQFVLFFFRFDCCAFVAKTNTVERSLNKIKLTYSFLVLWNKCTRSIQSNHIWNHYDWNRSERNHTVLCRTLTVWLRVHSCEHIEVAANAIKTKRSLNLSVGAFTKRRIGNIHKYLHKQQANAVYSTSQTDYRYYYYYLHDEFADPFRFCGPSIERVILSSQRFGRWLAADCVRSPAVVGVVLSVLVPRGLFVARVLYCTTNSTSSSFDRLFGWLQ